MCFAGTIRARPNGVGHPEGVRAPSPCVHRPPDGRANQPRRGARRNARGVDRRPDSGASDASGLPAPGAGARFRRMPAARSLVPARLVRALLWILAAVGALLLVVGVIWVTLPDPAPLARENPRTTALIEQRRIEAKAKKRVIRVQQSWVGLDRVSRR